MDRKAIVDIIWYFVLCLIAYVLFTYTFYVVVLLSLFYVTRLLLDRGAGETDIKDSAVLITGCDSGFGFDIARRLEAVGFTVFAGCLDQLGYGATQLKETSSPRLHVVSLDVTSDESVRDAVDYVKRHLPRKGLRGVVNNAGVNMHGEIELMTLGLLQKVMDINFFGAVRVTKAFLPLIRGSKGRIVNVTSVHGRCVHPCRGAYGASKYALEVVSDALRLEMKKFGVTVSILEPGCFGHATSIHSGAQHAQLLKNIDEMWKEASEEVKQTYNKDYVESWIEPQVGGWGSRGDTGPVVKAAEHALTSAWPKSRYLISGSAVIIDYYAVLALVNGILPSWLVDWYLTSRTRCHKFPS